LIPINFYGQKRPQKLQNPTTGCCCISENFEAKLKKVMMMQYCTQAVV